MNLIGYNLSWQSLVPSGGSKGESILCASQLLEAAGIPWLVAALLQLLLPWSRDLPLL